MISTTLGGLKLYNKPEYSYVVTLCAEFVAIALCPVTEHHCKESGTILWHLPLRYLYALMRFPLTKVWITPAICAILRLERTNAGLT